VKDPKDNKTPDLFPADPARKRGRPATGNALSTAERSKRYRERRKTEPKTQPPPLALSERAELEQLREIAATLENLVTRYEKEAAQHAEECRAFYDQVTRHMQTEARLNQTIESQNRRIAELEAKHSRKPRR